MVFSVVEKCNLFFKTSADTFISGLHVEAKASSQILLLTYENVSKRKTSASIIQSVDLNKEKWPYKKTTTFSLFFKRSSLDDEDTCRRE